jgi:hypothetical protein
MSKIEFAISIPTDEGFLGRECNNPQCHSYFRVHCDSIRNRMFCPYCGDVFVNEELHTPDQLDFAQKQAIEKAKGY